MALQPLTFNEKRLKWISAIEMQLLNFKINDEYAVGYGYTYIDAIKELYSSGYLVSTKIDDIVEEHFGRTDDKEDFEWKIAKILVLYYIVSVLPNLFNADESQKTSRFLSNIKINLTSYVPDYIINFPNNGIPSFEPTESKTVTDNLSDIPASEAEPIKELLQPLKSDVELIGYISKVYAKIEHFKFDSLSNLNEVDRGIARDAITLSKKIVNNVNSAKGHEGKSELTVRDIAHNFALNVSLFWKLVEINKANNKVKDLEG